ncbi:MAG: hypothetical protein FJ297_09255 [Planctomycetes bacterium]|nr:hypothetical protein [Planctomycetota bacterium]
MSWVRSRANRSIGRQPSDRRLARRESSARRAAFTLVEALLAMALAAVAASSILVAGYATLFELTGGMDRMLASGVARQVMNEIVGKPYCEPGTSAFATTLGTESGEADRSRFDDIDDYAKYACAPPADRWGVPLGQGDASGGSRPAAFQASSVCFSTWSVSVGVHYVAEGDWAVDLPAGQTSGYRAVDVVVSKTEQGIPRELARLRRVVAHVPNT